MNHHPVSPVAVALLHHPVYDKNRQVVTTAVTNLDIHDIARSAKTYGLCRYYIVTPVTEQQRLTERIREHWVEGWGSGYNPKRKLALQLVTISPDLDAAVADLASVSGREVKIVVTGAKARPDSIGFAELKGKMASGTEAFLLLLGTGWGMTEEVFGRADIILKPVRGTVEYNHLSVRSAAAIIFDRLFGLQ